MKLSDIYDAIVDVIYELKGPVSSIGVWQISFVVLKACDVVNWSWWAVFSPCLAYIALHILALILRTIVD